ncbi:hypothetical protein BV25DRAFT_1826892 [Artomyces pyxidatus]|uniref:Uncharacterized protein n=1 Tax=Artomyces pyxidatus TaxID=48021 RepID=A0ACB8SYA9_9AGAM|nr:hypothetical protein BV25DRAFT_1826892 [Artomyces pyxidatus]
MPRLPVSPSPRPTLLPPVAPRLDRMPVPQCIPGTDIRKGVDDFVEVGLPPRSRRQV